MYNVITLHYNHKHFKSNLKYYLKIDHTKKLFIVLLSIHFIFFIIKISLGDYFLADSYEYYNLAENIKNYFKFYSGDINSSIINPEYYTKRPPLYGIYILIFSCFLKSKVILLMTQNILSISSIFLCIKLFKNYYKRINRKILIIFLITSISQFIYANYLMSEILFQFLIVLLCYFFHEAFTKKNIYNFLYFQIVVILLFLTKPIFYLFIIPNIILCIWFTKHIKYAYVLSLIPIGICLLYMGWNNKRTGSFDFSSIQNINLKEYNLYYFHLNRYGEDYALKINSMISDHVDKKTTYRDKQNEMKSLTLKYIKKDFLSYTIAHFKGSIKMFFDPGRFDLYNFFEFKNAEEVGFLKHFNEGGIWGAYKYFKKQPLAIIILIPIILILNIFKVIGFILFWIKHYKTAPALQWFMLFIIIYITMLTGLIGASRFMVPLLPIYLLFATLGYTTKKSLIKF